jgi:hypothetical protein
MRWARHIARIGDNLFQSIGRKTWNREISRKIWEYTIEADLKEIGWNALDWIHLAQCMDKLPAL